MAILKARSAQQNQPNVLMLNIEILINDPAWQKENRLIASKIKTLIKKIAPKTALKKYLDSGVEIEISVVLGNDLEIKKLNKNYRQKNKPTNVLSFPAVDFKNMNKAEAEEFIMLGDIILAFETIKNEAAEQNKTFANHLYHLLIHSLLHLLGHDHEKEKEAKIMENLEIKLLKDLDIANPYII